MTKKGISNTFTAGALGGLLTSAVILGGFYLSGTFQTPSQKNVITTQTATPTSSLVTGTNPVVEDDQTVISAVNKVQDAIVSIANYQTTSNSLFGSFLPQQSNSEVAGEGSGVIYKVSQNEAFVVTNHHVIANAEELAVILRDGQSIPATLVGSDELTDLAVLKINSEHVKTQATFANSDDVQVGQTLLAIGSPLGSHLATTVTKGIASAVNRSVEVDTNADMQIDWEMESIQTDAAINPGNSGGALVNLDGNVIGINSMKISRQDVEGIGFAIPSNQVVDIITELEETGRVTRPFFGAHLISLSDISISQRESLLHLPEDVTSGVILNTVQSDSSADKAGLTQYDVIVSWNNTPIDTTIDLRKALYKHKSGDKVEVGYYRNGTLHHTTITIQHESLL